ncbi:hypothetical protein B0H11DRAFT_2224341 [Mycena galericulata]|nr:hypothetical protein B0H11DRAFT_2224341 [Mycena galericulata]
MSGYQPQIAIALATFGGCSAVLSFLNRSSDGKIKLPAELGEQNDPLDVTEPEDLLDGHPIDEPEFWARMRLR